MSVIDIAFGAFVAIGIVVAAAFIYGEAQKGDE